MGHLHLPALCSLNRSDTNNETGTRAAVLKCDPLIHASESGISEAANQRLLIAIVLKNISWELLKEQYHVKPSPKCGRKCITKARIPSCNNSNLPALNCNSTFFGHIHLPLSRWSISWFTVRFSNTIEFIWAASSYNQRNCVTFLLPKT